MSNIDLFSLFKSVTSALQDNRDSLNKADEYNANHGDNMVEIFDVITQAIKKKSGAEPADQLAYASKLLGKKKSGSAQVYAQGFSQASNQFQGKQVTQDNAMQLIQTLLGAGEPPPSSKPLEGLLGGLLGGEETEQQGDAGLDVGDLLNAGLAFMAAKDLGGSNAEALVNAVVSTSPHSQTPHRAQSSTLVTNTLLEMLGSLASKN